MFAGEEIYMNEEWLGTFYCLLFCAGFCTFSMMVWHVIEKIEILIEKYRDRNNEWK